MTQKRYEMMVGLEVHVALNSQSKMFCRCSSRFGDPPNTNVCPVCLGLPGGLPVPNQEAVRLGVRAALALNCEVHRRTRFDRKNYFYPDLTKGYQITQVYEPLGTNGYIDVGNPPKRIRIKRLHLEEDTGKSLHAGDDITTASYTLMDFNRSGVPLVEIVSEPHISTPEEARQYLEKMQRTLYFAGVSDVKMEEGSMRVDCNISVRPSGAKTPGARVELKNLSSLRAVTRALAYEYQRQVALVDRGEEVPQETRHWDEGKEVTFPLRQKDATVDYWSFPEPDMAYLELSSEFIQEVRDNMPELPSEIVGRYVNQLGLPEYDAEVLTQSPSLVHFFDSCVRLGAQPKTVSNWVMGDLLGYMKAKGLTHDQIPVSSENLVSMIGLIEKEVISGKIAKDVLIKMIETGKTPEAIVEEEGLKQVSDEASLLAVVDSVIESNAAAVADLKAGKDKALGFLVGQVMKATKGKANPAKVNIMLKKKILS
ncbi:MAG: Asp-tRNA(Asn)/Glu-tRNA(Gln) amidotransferase subunit GatB [Bacillota bacterium]|jgi:aspartyl-tRNA(Asn)/glutamyl-tRNA(Gln) amidotransferase subunit B